MFTEEQAIAELAHRVFLHGKESCKETRFLKGNRVRIHDLQPGKKEESGHLGPPSGGV